MLSPRPAGRMVRVRVRVWVRVRVRVWVWVTVSVRVWASVSVWVYLLRDHPFRFRIQYVGLIERPRLQTVLNQKC